MWCAINNYVLGRLPYGRKKKTWVKKKNNKKKPVKSLSQIREKKAAWGMG
jgi:hypothetical protein